MGDARQLSHVSLAWWRDLAFVRFSRRRGRGEGNTIHATPRGDGSIGGSAWELFSQRDDTRMEIVLVLNEYVHLILAHGCTSTQSIMIRSVYCWYREGGAASICHQEIGEQEFVSAVQNYV